MPEEAKKTIPKERRRYKRIKEAYSLRLRKFAFPFIESSDAWYKGNIINISACGILIVCQKEFFSLDLKIGDMLHMEVELGRWNDLKATDKPFDYYYQREPFTVLGNIIRFEDREEDHVLVGVDFIGVDESQRSSVFRFIQKKMSESVTGGQV